jgi:hypothetical protein
MQVLIECCNRPGIRSPEQESLGFVSMRGLFGLICVSLPLAGCISDRDLPFREAKYQASEAAQASGVITPQVAAECLERAATKLPHVKIVGAFSLAPSLASRVPVRMLTMLPSQENDDLVVLAAPSITDGMLGEHKTVAGCSYHFHDNRLVFNDVHVFGSRIDVVRRANPGGNVSRSRRPTGTTYHDADPRNRWRSQQDSNLQPTE